MSAQIAPAPGLAHVALPGDNRAVEALPEILRSLRVSSSIISHGSFSEPWAISTKGASAAIFHAVIRGRCRLELARGQDHVELSEGDVGLVTRGEAHVTAGGPTVRATPIASLAYDRAGTVARLVHGGGGDETEVICGSFALDHAASHTLLGLLPPLVRIAGGAGRSQWFEATLHLLASEFDGGMPGREAVVSRLAEVLVVHLLRAYFVSAPERDVGWLAALRDRQIGRALALIHAAPERDWSVEELAAEVGMSRATFFGRFGGLVGESPARYLTRWRIHTAADLLSRPEQNLSLGQIAERCGYRSEDAFSRAFKRLLGRTPRDYRDTSRDSKSCVGLHGGPEREKRA